MTTRIRPIVSNFNNLNVLVIGDTIVDRYVQGSTQRLCREAPVPIVDVQKERVALGGAANTAQNVAAMGARVDLLSVVGDDTAAKTVLKALARQRVSSQFIIKDSRRETLEKTRIMADEQLVVRYDVGSTAEVSLAAKEAISSILTDHFIMYDAVIISDYGYGVVFDELIPLLTKLSRQSPKVIVADGKSITRFAPLRPTAVKPNYLETLEILHVTPEEIADRVEEMPQYRHDLFRLTGAQLIALTLDKDGAILMEQQKSPYRTYTQPSPNTNAAGAGDTYVAALTLALASGVMSTTAGEIAAAAAAVVVQKQGTSTATQNEINAYFESSAKALESKEKVKALVSQYRSQGKKIVFTNGCFDILHRGHVTYLNTAKSLGDILIVGVNADESIKRLKGPERPINTLQDRLEVLAGLSSVDHVIPFTEDTPVNLIEYIRPNTFVKGGDYQKEDLPEAPIVEKYGGRIELLPYIQDKSTTGIIDKIKSQVMGNSSKERSKKAIKASI